MTSDNRPKWSRSLRLALLIAAVLGAVSGLFAWRQVHNEQAHDLEDITRRASALAQQLSGPALQAVIHPDRRATLRPQLEGYKRLLGYALLDLDMRLLLAGKALGELNAPFADMAQEALQARSETTRIVRAAGVRLHLHALPLFEQGRPLGVLLVAHDVSFLDDRGVARFAQYTFWVLLTTLLAIALVMGSTWFAYERPLNRLADWMRRLRTENVAEAPPRGLPAGFLRSESDRLAASFRAARSTGKALSEAALHTEKVWTSERLRAHALAALGDAHQLVVVSNREPYMHQWRNGKAQAIVPAGGLVTALDPVLQACGGVWIAHGAGDADRNTSDSGGRLTVPPDDPRYTLRRVWLSREEEQGYYYGFSNEGLWPLCHIAHERPIFRTEDWAHYVAVNRRFAEAVLEEVGDGPAVVLVQDYQMALVPRFIKETRPDLRVGLFWHIPWPNAEAFRICPWGAELLDGMLGADLIGFHLQQYGNNFLDTVDRTLESKLDWDHFAVELRGNRTAVRPLPISVQPWSERHVLADEGLAQQIAALKAQYLLGDSYVSVGVDRVDYTKGLPERFRAIACLLEKHPQYRGRFTHVALGAPSRTHIPRYREHLDRLSALADEINWKYRKDDWKPIHFLVGHHDAGTVYAFLNMAPMCIVSSLHDGMNLVAKEYVAAQPAGEGVLVLSEFAGAARDLTDALIVNPYDTEQFAETLRRGLEMDAEERRTRMQRLSRQVEEHNIYRWAASLLTELAATRAAGPESVNHRTSGP